MLENLGAHQFLPYDEVDLKQFDKVFNLSDPCPAAIYESARLQNTDKSRVQIFANALGFSTSQFLGKRPVWVWTKEEERDLALLRISFGAHSTIGIGLQSSDYYRDYAHTTELINLFVESSKIDYILLFGTKMPEGIVESEKIIAVTNKPIREAVMQQAVCDYFITPDTFFLHSAAALNISTMLLEGPLANNFRFYGYPIKRVSAAMDCVPCWRNTYTPCKHAPQELQRSVCMEKLTPSFIVHSFLEGLMS